MSKSVDDTVFDYFSLLLTEDNDEQPLESPKKVQASSIKQHKPEAPTVQLQAIKPQAALAPSYIEAKPKLVNPKLDKQALEELLAPVFKTESIEPVVVTPVEVKAKIKPIIKQKIDVDSKVAKQIKVKQNEAEKQIVETVVTDDIVPATKVETAATPPSITKDLQEQLDDEFQVLFFKVAGLTLAVPLVSLGGIVQVDRINQIIGRPAWFLGVQSHRETQLNLVNTCAWVMPEKYDETLAQNVNYQYLVVLEDSNWALACESLINTVKVNKSEVNWRGKAGKRPWLAGVVKEQMCGILNVQALIKMLNEGLGCQDPID